MLHQVNPFRGKNPVCSQPQALGEFPRTASDISTFRILGAMPQVPEAWMAPYPASRDRWPNMPALNWSTII